MGQARRARRGPPGTRGEGLPARAQIWFTPVNGACLGLALLVLAAGYALLAYGSTVAAPMLLVLGYVVLVPLGLMLRPRRARREPHADAAGPPTAPDPTPDA
jgi:hypothetical protein